MNVPQPLNRLVRPTAILLLGSAALAQQQAPTTSPVTPRQLWEKLEKQLPEFRFEVRSDREVVAEIHPRPKLRRVEIFCSSQRVLGKTLWHNGVIFLPVDPELLRSPERRGKVVIVGAVGWDCWESFLVNYGQLIAVRTGYPVLVLEVPGWTDEEPRREYCLELVEYVRKTPDPMFHHFFRSAIPYYRGVQILAKVLGLEEGEVRAIIGGHSKRATGAYTAAAIWPDSIAGVVYMGNENTFDHRRGTPLEATSPYFTQRFVRCPSFYLGATNEGGYAMFNMNRFMENMERPWTVEYVPNHRHSPDHEKMYRCWPMWVSHVFDGRPLSLIRDFRAVDVERGTRFQARIDSPNRILRADLWYTYCDDVPYWRDLTWYPTSMRRGEGDEWEGYVHGRVPDAWLVEVEDVAQGIRGYVSTLPQNLTGKESRTRPRDSDGHPRVWTREKEG